MKKYILSFLAVSVLSLSFSIVSPMMVRFSGVTGKLLEMVEHTHSQVNVGEARYIHCLRDISNLSAKIQVLQNGGGNGDIVLYLTW